MILPGTALRCCRRHRYDADLEGQKDVDLGLPRPPEYTAPEQLLDQSLVSLSRFVSGLQACDRSEV